MSLTVIIMVSEAALEGGVPANTNVSLSKESQSGVAAVADVMSSEEASAPSSLSCFDKPSFFIGD
jgi:hypothetical protein